MTVIETKYSVGDTVWLAATTTTQKQHNCPDCLGSRKWEAKSPAGDDFTFSCPRCTANYSAHDELSLTYTAHAPRVERLTIGSVRVNTADTERGDEPVSYMCRETGVGSGTVYRQSQLFPSKDEAEKSAALLAKTRDKEVSWVAKRYDRTLQISDYQITNAAMQCATRERHAAGRLLWTLSELFDAIQEADDKDAILEAIDEYKSRDWARDKAAAEQVQA